MAYLLRFDAKRPVVSFVGTPQIGGGFFYNDYAPRDAQPVRSSDGEKRARRELFDYCVLGTAERAGAHLLPHARVVPGARTTLPRDDCARRSCNA